MVGKLRCQYCNGLFTPSHHMERYCSEDCRVKGRHGGARLRKSVQCRHCRVEVPPNEKGFQAFYCSDECRTRYLKATRLAKDFVEESLWVD